MSVVIRGKNGIEVNQQNPEALTRMDQGFGWVDRRLDSWGDRSPDSGFSKGADPGNHARYGCDPSRSGSGGSAVVMGKSVQKPHKENDEMNKGFGNVFAAIAGVWLVSLALVVVVLPSSAGAYGPSTMYTPPAGSLAPGALYARAMQTSNGKMYATFEQYTTGIAMFPIFESTDSGRTWKKVGDVKDTHKGVGMRWEPHLYQLPQAIGDMPAGTLLAAGLVLPYNRSACQIDLYKSNDEGRTWTYVSTIAIGTQANPGSDPVWEPFIMVANNKLYVFYSDERDPAYSQKLVHQSSADGIKWSSVVTDVAITGQRPGMVTVAQMANGNYIMAYEIIGTPEGSSFKTTANIDNWNAGDKGTVFDPKGSSPYCISMNGTVIIASAGSGSLFTNANNGVGAWTMISSPVGANYSRALVPLNNGRIFVIGAGWNGTGLNNVTYGDLAFGCAPTAIVPAMKVNSDPWQNVSSDTVNAGATVVFGPQPVVATGWSWSGPNGYSATTREITIANAAASHAGIYTATYTSPSGCKSTQKFALSVNNPTHILSLRSSGGRGNRQLDVRIEGLNLQSFDNGSDVRIFNIQGSSVFQARIQASALNVSGLQPGMYVVEVRRDQAVLARKSFVME